MNSSPVKLEVHRYGYLRQQLLEAFPDVDEETIRDTLEGITTLNELIAEIIRSALIDQALQAGLRLRLEDMRKRLARLEAREIKKREMALEAMSEVGLTKLAQPDFTVSVRKGVPSLLTTTETEIPASYWVPQPPKLDRQALLNELKRGVEIPGASLNNAKPTLAVRTR